MLVSIDGAGASHEIIDHLTSLNTAAVHGKRGRRVEYTIGWPVDERTLAGISELRQRDWGDAVDELGGVFLGVGQVHLEPVDPQQPPLPQPRPPRLGVGPGRCAKSFRLVMRCFLGVGAGPGWRV